MAVHDLPAGERAAMLRPAARQLGRAFGEEANFGAILDGLLDAGYTDDEMGKVMGGNFFRMWRQVSTSTDGHRR